MTHLNYTGRRRITRGRIDVVGAVTARGPELTVRRLDLDELDLPGDARIYLEVYRETDLDRIDAGTVGAPLLPAAHPLALFRDLSSVNFRVKVVRGGSERGRIVAAAAGLSLDSDEDTDSVPLLPTRLSPIGDRAWHLDLTEQPTLIINSSIPNGKAVATGPAFLALVYPEVLRRVIEWVRENEGSEETYHENWRHFLLDLGMTPDSLMSTADDDQSVDDALDRFASRHGILIRFTNALAGVEADGG
jgi:hypothetical protein